MSNKQLWYLFGSSCIVLIVGMGLFPLLPLYDAQFNATPTIIGLHFALMYLANAAGAALVSPLSGRFTRKVLFISAAALGVPALLLLVVSNALWQVVTLTMILWFSGGLVLALVNVFTSSQSGEGKRGRSFSLISLAYPIGALLGGSLIGRVVAWHGYPLMFAVLGVIWVGLPLLGLLIEDKASTSSSSNPSSAAQAAGTLGPVFVTLLGITLLSGIAISAGRLSTTMAMKGLGYEAAAVSTATMVSGLVAIPVTMMIGTLSDRLGRERLLALVLALMGMGVLTLALASSLWHFCLAASLIMIALCASGAVSSALATDRLDASTLNRALPLLKAVHSAAGMISFIGTGFLLDTVGLGVLYALIGVLVVGAILLVTQLSMKRATAPARLMRKARSVQPTPIAK